MNAFLEVILLVFCYMCLWFIISLVKHNNSVADIAWGLGFVVISWCFQSSNHWLLLLMVSLWGVRLAGYLFIRNWNKTEDWRYKNWREDWGKQILIRSFFQVFMLQGFFMILIAIPLFLHTTTISIWTIIPGFLIWFIGFLWESLADWQLYQFKRQADTKGQVLKSGLWKYSRHPNYFGEILVWWGIFLVALPHPYWYILIISPIIISYLLLRVSGVPMLESKYSDHPEYQTYVKNTPSVFPRWKINN